MRTKIPEHIEITCDWCGAEIVDPKTVYFITAQRTNEPLLHADVCPACFIIFQPGAEVPRPFLESKEVPL